VQGIADRDPDASNVIGIELNVVGDQVEMGLGPDKEAAPKIVADATPDVDHEMIAARVGAATRKVIGIAGSVPVVEKYAFATNASHQLGAYFPAYSRRVDAIKVIKDRPKTLIAVI
jgi:hypothetical protein